MVVRLSELNKGASGIVVRVDDSGPADVIAGRLRDLGFVSGEPIRVIAHGPIGADPLVVQIGFTRFALRRAEAARIRVETAPPS
jgi:ferrous iron transport protein A